MNTAKHAQVAAMVNEFGPEAGESNRDETKETSGSGGVCEKPFEVTR
jgi:hypothetical protein